jgi:predicted RecB family nuclease
MVLVHDDEGYFLGSLSRRSINLPLLMHEKENEISWEGLCIDFFDGMQHHIYHYNTSSRKKRFLEVIRTNLPIEVSTEI